MPEPQNTWRKYSLNASSSGSCAAILRTRRLTVNVTSTISSSVGVYPAAHQPQAYSSLSTLFNVVLELSTPPHPGHSTFHDSSKIPSRAACRKAAITCSSSSPLFAAKSSTLTRHRARSGASRTNASIASTVPGSADWRRTANRLLASLIVASPSRIRQLWASFGLRESFADPALSTTRHRNVAITRQLFGDESSKRQRCLPPPVAIMLSASLGDHGS